MLQIELAVWVEETTVARAGGEQGQKPLLQGMKQASHKRTHPLWFHPYEYLEQSFIAPESGRVVSRG